MPLLPVGPLTIIYGSADGGKTIHAAVPEMNARMKLAAEILNLGPETIWNSTFETKTKVDRAIDIEAGSRWMVAWRELMRLVMADSWSDGHRRSSRSRPSILCA